MKSNIIHHEHSPEKRCRSLQRAFYVGQRAAALLARRFLSLEAIAGASLETIDDVPEIGPVVARSVREWFDDAGNRRVVARLAAAGVRVEDEAPAGASQALAGKQFVLTGALQSMTREAAKAAIEARGGRVTSSVSKKTSYVVVGAEAGSKLERARELGIETPDEAGLRALLASV